MTTTILTLIWMVALFIFLTYTLISVMFRAFSYRTYYEAFAGNQKPEQIDPNLVYYVIIPCFNEGTVILNTIIKLLAFQRFEIVVVDDASSDDSVKQIQSIHNPHAHLLRRHEPDAHTGKGDVLNFALDFIRSKLAPNTDTDEVIIGVVDADAELAPNVVDRLDRYFSSPNGNITQMRVKMYPQVKNILQLLQDIEFFSINHMSQVMRMFTHTVGLSGNGQFFRLTPIIEKIGTHPWGNALLDDYELTIKMMLKGLHVDYMTETYVYQEALTSVKRFIRQRSRWVQGDLNCLKYLPRIIKSKELVLSQKIGIYYFLAQPWINLIADITIILLTIFTFLHLDHLFDDLGGLSLIVALLMIVVFSLLWGIIFSLFYHHDLGHFKEPRLAIKWYLMLPIGVSYMYIILFFSIVMAFWRWIFHENSWIKTTHGKE